MPIDPNFDYSSLFGLNATSNAVASPNYASNMNIAQNSWDGNNFKIGGLLGQSTHQAQETALPNAPTPTQSQPVDYSQVAGDVRGLLGIDDLISQLQGLNGNVGGLLDNGTQPSAPTVAPSNPAPPVSPPVYQPPVNVPAPTQPASPSPAQPPAYQGGGNTPTDYGLPTNEPTFEDNLFGGGAIATPTAPSAPVVPSQPAPLPATPTPQPAAPTYGQPILTPEQLAQVERDLAAIGGGFGGYGSLF